MISSDLHPLLLAATDLYCLSGGRRLALERAAVWLRQLLAESPRQPEALRLLGLVELERKRPARAARAFEVLAKLAAADHRLTGLWGMAECHLSRGRAAAAHVALARARSVDLAARGASLDVLHRYYATKARVLGELGEHERALRVLRRTAQRLARAGLDAEPLVFELAVHLSATPLLDHLPALEVVPTARRARRVSSGYIVDRATYRRIVAACHGSHQERCGLLFGRGRRIDRLRLLRNRSDQPEISAESAPHQRQRLWREERQADRVLLAEFHSHTVGPALPSRADTVGPSRLLVIYSDLYDELRAWRVGRGYRKALRSERSIRVVANRRRP